MRLVCKATGLEMEVSEAASGRYVGRGFDVAERGSDSAFEEMTNAELVSYIEERGGRLPKKANKANLISAAEQIS